MNRLPVGLLGGTFDPVHQGHIAAAHLVRERLGLTQVWLMPTHVPPHRSQEPRVSPFHRFAMTALACAGQTGLTALPLELEQPGISYTADTLARLHERQVAASQIFFITGADAFAEIATWKRYPTVLDMAIFTVVGRTTLSLDAVEARLPDLAPRWVRVRDANDREALLRRAVSEVPRPIALLEGTLPDVSATAVRDRLRAGQSISGLVPELVAEYIFRHHLYGERGDGAASM
jgi:nicotinate-nucleotide adenylyltransferase